MVGVDDVIGKLMWFQEFIKMQGFAPGRTTLLQDNQSPMLLEMKEKASLTKRTRHINMRYFHIFALVEKVRVGVEYCNTKEMVADFFTKPLKGEAFLRSKTLTLGQK